MSGDEIPTESVFQDIGERLRLIIEHLGYDKSVTATGKSSRQLKRYCDGAEPPFSVMKNLCEASGTTLGWVTYGDAATENDIRLNIESHKNRLDDLRRVLMRGGPSSELELAREESSLLYEQIGLETVQLDLVSKLGKKFKGSIQARMTEQPPLPARIEPSVIERIARVVTAAYKEAGHKLAAEKVAVEAATLYNELVSKVSDMNDNDEIDATLPQLKYSLKKRLEAAAVEPGTGKRSA